jgi:hypothetical protein
MGQYSADELYGIEAQLNLWEGWDYSLYLISGLLFSHKLLSFSNLVWFAYLVRRVLVKGNI